MKSEPLKLLMKSLNGEVLVKLKDGRTCRGLLEHCDGYMNLILSEAREVDGENDDITTVNYGKILIRGSNVLWVKLRP
ncbi:MAG: LSM domain-containing protein [Candidatus Nezhaarchaeales archaeon]